MSGVSWEEELCGGSGARGIVYIGDSVMMMMRRMVMDDGAVTMMVMVTMIMLVKSVL